MAGPAIDAGGRTAPEARGSRSATAEWGRVVGCGLVHCVARTLRYSRLKECDGERVDPHVLDFNNSSFCQTLPERREIRCKGIRRACAQISDHLHRLLLRAHREWP